MACAVALAHVRALDVPEASGQRFITSQGPFAGQDYCDVSLRRRHKAAVAYLTSGQVLHKRFPDLPNIPVGKPNTHDELVKDMNVFDGFKATKVLGIKYIPFEETVVEMAESLKKRFNF
jgi:nucleoside-diphosphate-sugar epimerase